MPTYEYRCPACSHEFELFQRMSDEPGAVCPSCGKAAVRRLSGGAGFLFKGSGFYITDYRSDSYKKAAGSEGGGGEKSGEKGGEKSGEKGESRGTDKSESKPAASSGSDKSEKGGSSSSSDAKGSSKPKAD